jgi:ribosomal protein S18 acetylase RimI-like enzyme
MNPLNLIIQPVELSQLQALRSISINTFVEAFEADNTEENMQRYILESLSETKLREELSNQYSAFYFALQDDVMVGYLKINFADAQSDVRDAESMEIERIYVYKSHHGKHVGQALLDFAMNCANEKKLQYVWLGVWEHNPRAIRFYEKNGFTVFGNHAFKLGDDEQTDVLMKRMCS